MINPAVEGWTINRTTVPVVVFLFCHWYQKQSIASVRRNKENEYNKKTGLINAGVYTYLFISGLNYI